MSLMLPHPPSDRKRVKVYELRNTNWFDRGTGFCMSQNIDVGERHVIDQSSRMGPRSCVVGVPETDRGVWWQIG